VLSTEADVTLLPVTPHGGSERPFPLSAERDERDVCDLDATGNCERYITGGEKFHLYYLCMGCSEIRQILLSNARQPT